METVRLYQEGTRCLVAVNNHFVKPVGSFDQLNAFEVPVLNFVQPVVPAQIFFRFEKAV